MGFPLIHRGRVFDAFAPAGNTMDDRSTPFGGLAAVGSAGALLLELAGRQPLGVLDALALRRRTTRFKPRAVGADRMRWWRLAVTREVKRSLEKL